MFSLVDAFTSHDRQVQKQEQIVKRKQQVSPGGRGGSAGGGGGGAVRTVPGRLVEDDVWKPQTNADTRKYQGSHFLNAPHPHPFQFPPLSSFIQTFGGTP